MYITDIMYICHNCGKNTAWKVPNAPVCGHSMCMVCFINTVTNDVNIKCPLCKTIKKGISTGDIRQKRVHWGDIDGVCQQISTIIER